MDWHLQKYWGFTSFCALELKPFFGFRHNFGFQIENVKKKEKEWHAVWLSRCYRLLDWRWHQVRQTLLTRMKWDKWAKRAWAKLLKKLFALWDKEHLTVEEDSRTGDGEAVSTRGHGECGGGGAGVSAELKGAFSDELHSTLLTKATQAHTHTHSVQLVHSSQWESSSWRGCFARRNTPSGPQTLSSPAVEIIKEMSHLLHGNYFFSPLKETRKKIIIFLSSSKNIYGSKK